jgi:hypothetical protein
MKDYFVAIAIVNGIIDKEEVDPEAGTIFDVPF